MNPLFRSIVNFFNTDKNVYSHRHRTIELIAVEKNMDIDAIKKETKAIIVSQGSVEAVIQLRKRFHVPLASAWIFVDKLQ